MVAGQMGRLCGSFAIARQIRGSGIPVSFFVWGLTFRHDLDRAAITGAAPAVASWLQLPRHSPISQVWGLPRALPGSKMAVAAGWHWCPAAIGEAIDTVPGIPAEWGPWIMKTTTTVANNSRRRLQRGRALCRARVCGFV